MFSSPLLIFPYHHPIVKCSNNLYLDKFGEPHEEEVMENYMCAWPQLKL